ncbi:hypothetical protein RHMOL_Rhmol01G0149100 [Rhododendron molle]|uniref:Uncharacterized protein n=1 Tax=Rhododendron molle TaxID=49168 RepID=A0ACC0Q1H8_RHOML|nr:hypothetical protein RHMOL_Rhmol01G0149100 [Rhododendron molle]
MLSNNSLHCGTIPLLVTDSGPNNANQGNSSSVGRVNLLDFLESVSVPNNDSLAIKEDDILTVQQVKGLNQEVTALRAELDSKNKVIESINSSGIALPGGVEMGSSWRDKVAPPGVSNTRMTFQYFPPTVEGDRITVSPPSAVEVQGAEKWKDCLVVDSSVDNTSEGVMGLTVAEVCSDSGVLVIKESLGHLMGSDPNTSKGVEVDQNGILPDVLGVGMEDPDALFQALISTKVKDSTKPNEGKNPRATKRGMKPKYR